MTPRILIAVLLSLGGSSAAAQDFSGIPTSILAQIKAKCIEQWPGDYLMQDGCIQVQSEAYLKVHGTQTGTENVPSAYDKAQINNAVYLLVADTICKLDTLRLAAEYRRRAEAGGRISPDQAFELILTGVNDDGPKIIGGDRQKFCREAKRNLPNFIADLRN